MLLAKHLVSLWTFSPSFPALFDYSSQSAGGFCWQGIVPSWQLAEPRWARRRFFTKAGREGRELPAKCGHQHGGATVGTLQKGLEDGSKAHVIQLEPQTGLDGRGEQLLQLEAGQDVLKYQLAKLSPKHASGPGVSRITGLVSSAAIFPGSGRTGGDHHQELTDPPCLEPLWGFC